MCSSYYTKNYHVKVSYFSRNFPHISRPYSSHCYCHCHLKCLHGGHVFSIEVVRPLVDFLISEATSQIIFIVILLPVLVFSRVLFQLVSYYPSVNFVFFFLPTES
jgi:hypothetical protein